MPQIVNFSIGILRRQPLTQARQIVCQLPVCFVARLAEEMLVISHKLSNWRIASAAHKRLAAASVFSLSKKVNIARVANRKKIQIPAPGRISVDSVKL